MSTRLSIASGSGRPGSLKKPGDEQYRSIADVMTAALLVKRKSQANLNVPYMSRRNTCAVDLQENSFAANSSSGRQLSSADHRKSFAFFRAREPSILPDSRYLPDASFRMGIQECDDSSEHLSNNSNE